MVTKTVRASRAFAWVYEVVGVTSPYGAQIERTPVLGFLTLQSQGGSHEMGRRT